MAKRIRQKKGKKREKVKQIDNIAKYSQQRRSPAPKRRTDFSLFFFLSSSSPSSSSSLSNALLHQDKPNSSGSSQTKSDFLERRRRGKRTRKPKVHFDETTFPLSSVRKVRRLRIMRFLGLIAPAGSPFSLAHV